MPGDAQKRNNLLQSQYVDPPVPQPPASPEAVAAAYAQAAALQQITNALREAFFEEPLCEPLQSNVAIQIRDYAVRITSIHNPTGNAVTVTLSLDPNTQPIISANIAAGGVLSFGQTGLVLPRLAGFVNSGYVTLGGTLPD